MRKDKFIAFEETRVKNQLINYRLICLLKTTWNSFAHIYIFFLISKNKDYKRLLPVAIFGLGLKVLPTIWFLIYDSCKTNA